jgi:hypothetical protein
VSLQIHQHLCQRRQRCQDLLPHLQHHLHDLRLRMWKPAGFWTLMADPLRSPRMPAAFQYLVHNMILSTASSDLHGLCKMASGRSLKTEYLGPRFPSATSPEMANLWNAW